MSAASLLCRPIVNCLQLINKESPPPSTSGESHRKPQHTYYDCDTLIHHFSRICCPYPRMGRVYSRHHLAIELITTINNIIIVQNQQSLLLHTINQFSFLRSVYTQLGTGVARKILTKRLASQISPFTIAGNLVFPPGPRGTHPCMTSSISVQQAKTIQVSLRGNISLEPS